MKLIKYILAAAMLFTFVSCGKQKDYTMESFRAEIGALDEDAAVVALAKDYIKNTGDMVLIIEAQDAWMEVDDFSAREYFKSGYESSPNNAQKVYLYGRALENPLEAVELGRRVIELSPEIPYGYRLVCSTYANTLFRDSGEAKVLEKMAHILPEDAAHFDKYLEIGGDSSAALGYLEGFKVYTGAYDEALKILALGESMEAYWAGPMEEARIYALMGEFDRIEPLVSQYVNALVEGGRIPETAKAEYTDHYIKRTLRKAKAYGEVIEYIISQEGYENNPDALYDIACYSALAEEKNKAFKSLRLAAKAGFSFLSRAEKDEDLASLKGGAEWDVIISEFTVNWEKGKAERRKAALAAKMDMEAPEWALPDGKGDTVRLEDLRGKVVVLDFFATWCAPCLKAMPEIDEFTREHSDEKVAVFSINLWERGREKVKRFMRDKDYSMALLFGSRQLGNLYEVRGIPTLFVIDKEGKIRYEEVGYEEGLKEKLGWWAEDLLE